MADMCDGFDWKALGEQQWLANAQDGYIEVMGDADNGLCTTLYRLVNKWLILPQTQPSDIFMVIRCTSGAPGSFDIAKMMCGLPCRTEARRDAGSAGLSLFLAGEERLAQHRSKFTFHGNLYRFLQGDPSDMDRAAWFAERTKMDHEWWLDKARMDGLLEFGIDEALEWGVATGIVE